MAEDLIKQDATQLQSLLAAGSLSSEQLVRARLAAIAQRDPQINSFICVDETGALAAARASDARRQQGKLLSPIDGLTLAVKDNIDVQGLVTTAGLGRLDAAPPASADAFAVTQLRAAGMIILGKLNMHEAALGASNANPHHGNCFNPLRDGYTPGGSSGGSGAAVAAGFCCLALGTDTMGSVRIPAAYCGVTGLKASQGAISIGGTFILNRRLDNVGPLTKSARDLALFMPHLMAVDADCVQSRASSELTVPAELTQLRIGVAEGLQTAAQPAIAQAFTRACDQFRAAGFSVTAIDLSGLDAGRARRAGLLACELELACQHQELLAAHPQIFSDDLKKLIDYGQTKSGADLMRADLVMDQAAQQLRRALAKVDCLLLPTAPQVAFSFSEPVPANQADYTSVANMSGQPALSLPMGCDAEGLPMGLQLVANHGGEAQLMALASWFETQQASAS